MLAKLGPFVATTHTILLHILVMPNDGGPSRRKAISTGLDGADHRGRQQQRRFVYAASKQQDFVPYIVATSTKERLRTRRQRASHHVTSKKFDKMAREVIILRVQVGA